MIYQKINSLIENGDEISESVLKKELKIHFDSKEFNLSETLTDIVSLFLDYKTIQPLSTIIVDHFDILFERGLTLSNLGTYEVYKDSDRTEKRKFNQIYLNSIRDLLSKPINNRLMLELDSPNKPLFDFVKQINYSNIIPQNLIKKLWQSFNLDSDKDFRNEFLLSTTTFNQMEKICEEMQISPWIVVNKKNDIETLWPTSIWQLENLLMARNPLKASYDYRKKFFANGMREWKKISTPNSSQIDLQSRILFFACTLKNDLVLSDFLKELEINQVNLNCEDQISPSKPKIKLQERLLQQGKLKTLNKFNKVQKLDIDLDKLIASIPTKANLISTKKAFLKQWLNSHEVETNNEKLLISVLNSRHKKYEEGEIGIKCYLPIHKNCLDEKEEFWKINKDKISRNSYNDLMFLYFEDSPTQVSLKSYVNLLDWLETKPTNWTLKLENGNSLISETIICSMQLPLDVYTQRLSSDTGTLIKAIELLTHEKQKEIINSVKDSWKEIWTSPKAKSHAYYILNPNYDRPSLTFDFLNKLTLICLKNSIKFESSFFNENWNKIKKDLEPYKEQNTSVKEFLANSSVLELSNTLIKNENTTQRKPNKI
jgi:hypothetical protein